MELSGRRRYLTFDLTAWEAIDRAGFLAGGIKYMLRHLQLATVHEVIRLADADQASDKSEGVSTLSDLSAAEITRMTAVTPEAQALRNYLKRLPDDQMSELMALMWLGRGAGGECRDEYPKLVEDASRKLDRAAYYIAEKAPLTDYLRAGLAKLE